MMTFASKALTAKLRFCKPWSRVQFLVGAEALATTKTLDA